MDMHTATHIATKIITPADPDFPYLLTKASTHMTPSLAPKRLFVQGSMPRCDEKSPLKFLCVVGARKHSSYGREVCERLIEGLAGYNVCIVSGLALGIDSIAHESALRAGLSTIAFPGSGLDPDVLYPARNQRLAERIVQNGTGALVSEFDMDFHATDWSFPQRNRLMAGISHATLVVEAKLGSGTLITSGLASDYNRDVFAVPGYIFSKLSEGPNMLISKGAAIIRSSEDILNELGIEMKKITAPTSKKPQLSEIFEMSEIPDINEEEKNILDLLIEPIEKDHLIRQIQDKYDKNISEINVLLSMMEISGLIAEENGITSAQ